MTHLRFLAVHCIEMDRCFASSPCMYPAFITTMMILWLYENHEKEAVASHNTEKVCYVKFLLCFRLLKWILITKRREKNISHLATRQMCSLLHSSSCTENYFRRENWNYIRCIIVRVRNLHKKYEVEKKLIKIKAEKNWDVDKAQQKAKQEAEEGERRKCDNLCGLGKRFFEGRLGHVVWVNNFSTVMNESRTWFIDKSFFSSSIPEMLLVGNSRLIERFLIVCLGPERRAGLRKQQHNVS